ncbi:MAG: peptidoglycan bridge formation glycyltransferase FemA/FemB family protein [Bacteroidota bacterium]
MEISTTIISNPKNATIEEIESFYDKVSYPNYFHSYAHYLSAKANPSTKPVYIIAKDNKDNITGLALIVTHQASGFPLNFLTRRAVLYGAPLAENKDTQTEIINKILQYVKSKHLFVQFRVNMSKHEMLHSYRGVFNTQDYLNVLIHNEGKTKAWKALSRSKRWQIKKSKTNGAYIKLAESRKEIIAWYQILKHLYHYRIKKPVPPFQFFNALINSKSIKNASKLLVVKHNDKVIAGILLTLSGQTSVHEWYVCGQDETYKNLNIYPSVMATWAGIEYMIENDFEYFDFMGAGRPHIPYGVREFKERFGGELIDVIRYTHFPPNIYSNIFQKFNFI